MLVFKSVCFSLLVSALLSCNIVMAQEDMSADDLCKKAEQYDWQENYENAMQWYLKAANKGNDWAMERIGNFYNKGLGVKQDYQQAMEWYLKAADKGNTNAMNSIGYIYEGGLGFKQDYHKAMLWYLKATDKGDFIAMYNVGILYEDGLGVDKDPKKAKFWYEKAEEANRNSLKKYQ